MAVAQFIQLGNSIDHTPAAAVAAGEVIVQGDLVGIAQLDVAAGQLGALALTGVFDIDKATGVGTGIAVGTKVYWDAANKQATSADGGGVNKYLGKVTATAGDDATKVRVRLQQ
jgi:predicted RecA/RadA family phage recombinase